ncbi:hypothetical protein [Nitrosopumilus sp. K4]|uniref:hypothetical protein n=1 Tax=Nitrosopumilus sp. K4 TaxID=2795383 RepID=UPI00201224E2|nr:hypothetical protein [Nitrosopumilus sp. K4]
MNPFFILVLLFAFVGLLLPPVVYAQEWKDRWMDFKSSECNYSLDGQNWEFEDGYGTRGSIWDNPSGFSWLHPNEIQLLMIACKSHHAFETEIGIAYADQLITFLIYKDDSLASYVFSELEKGIPISGVLYGGKDQEYLKKVIDHNNLKKYFAEPRWIDDDFGKLDYTLIGKKQSAITEKTNNVLMISSIDVYLTTEYNEGARPQPNDAYLSPPGVNIDKLHEVSKKILNTRIDDFEEIPEEEFDTRADIALDAEGTCIDMEQAKPVGQFVGVFGEVYVKPLGCNYWKPAVKGLLFHEGSEILTVDKSRARVEFDDHLSQRIQHDKESFSPYVYSGNGAGPTTINISPNTQFVVEDYITQLTDGEPEQQGVIDIIRGKIRAFAKGWGQNSMFSIKGGVGICWIRGSEVIVSHDPDTGSFEAMVKEGLMEVQNTQSEKTFVLTDNQMVSGNRDNFVKSVLSDQKWNTAMTSSGLDDDVFGTPISESHEKKVEQSKKSKNIPDWIRNNAKWWADGSIDDNSFVQGLQFLIKEGIMKIPPTTQGAGSGSNEIPAWIKNNAKWWADGSIDDNSFVQGIQFMVKEGIIKIN